MNLKRIICLILAAIIVLGLVASGVMILVSAEAPTTSASTAATESTQPTQGQPQEMKNGDKIIFFILGAVVPCIIFLVMIIRTVWKKN